MVAVIAGRDDSRGAAVAPVIDARPIATDGAIDAVVKAVGDAAAPPPPMTDAAVPADASEATDASGLAPKPPPTTNPPPPVARAPGELVVLVKPWATLWLDGTPVGETPYRVSLPAGRHSLRLVNEERGKNEWVTVTVMPGKATTIERNW